MMAPKQRGPGDVGPTRPGHLNTRSLSTSRGGQPSKSGGGKPPKKGCVLALIVGVGLGTAGVLQGSYVAYSLLSQVV